MVEKLLLIWRQFAWVNNNQKFIHQRLHVEHLKRQFSNNINKHTLSENKLNILSMVSRFNYLLGKGVWYCLFPLWASKSKK